MKMQLRLIAFMLCICLCLSLAGCRQEPDSTVPSTQPSQSTQPTEPATQPTETEPPAPDHAAMYQDATAWLDEKESLCMLLTSEKTMTVSNQTFRSGTSHTLTYHGLGTDSLSAKAVSTYSWGNTTDHVTEVLLDGTVYMTTGGFLFSSPSTNTDFTCRYAPAVLLDITLYPDITVSEDGTLWTVSGAQALESWLIRDGAALESASGEVQLDADGRLSASTYTVSYSYGAITVSETYSVTILDNEPAAVEAPANAADYLNVESIEAIHLMNGAYGHLDQLQKYSTVSTKSVMSQAGGVVRNYSTYTDAYGTGSDFMARIEQSIYQMDYSTGTGVESTYDLEETFIDGVYTMREDKGEAQTVPGVTADILETYCYEILVENFLSLEYFASAKATDLGNVYFLEFTGTEELSQLLGQEIAYDLYQDPDFLNNLADSYKTTAMDIYLAVDKYTGFPTAVGFNYDASHTIYGDPYQLTMQLDQSFDLESLSAYETITEEPEPETEPENKATPLFYHVTGENGQEMWLFGTIHVGDERTGFLPQEIYDAFAASDALALEYNSEAFDEQVENDEDLQSDISEAYYYSDGTTTADHVSEEIYELALMHMKASGNYNSNVPYMKPSIWSNSIENFYLRQGCHLSSEQGVEERLTKLAKEQNKEILDVESGLFQIRMLTGWSEELQELLLEESIHGDAIDYWQSVDELYEQWCAGDEAVLREALSDEVDTSEFTEEELAEYEAQLPLLEEYNKAMSYDRNDGMLQKAIEYLESGDVVFYAVGLAHLLNDVNGLVDTLRQAGYTVELVTYN